MKTLAQSDRLPLPFPPLPPKHLFTATDVAAAELLVQISWSSASASSSSSSSASSSPPSVNTRPLVEAFLKEAEEEEALGLWRRTKRYRAIADLYASTEPIDASVGEKRSRR